MIVYQISLPKTKNADEFIRFMKEEYIPSIHQGPTRIGEVTGLSLQQKQESAEHSFLWQVDWSGLPGRKPQLDEESIKKKLDAFGVKIKHLGEFKEVAGWTKEK